MCACTEQAGTRSSTSEGFATEGGKAQKKGKKGGRANKKGWSQGRKGKGDGWEELHVGDNGRGRGGRFGLGKKVGQRNN